ALILASIVEKETYREREMVAGVYLRRLKIHMRLQSCPTVIYAHKKGDKLGHNLKYSELTIDDPYNTYLHSGLPPTPISSPGRSSIIAVLHPKETENLFFVFDGVKQHIFSKTFEKHRSNSAKIRNRNASQAN
ncbi:MAG: endolytic transglycosylase MltG, partial [Holosporaceae bacterium]|nr:endolytic transglycosylase MltG [Holosporaceae bacterium]